MMTAVVITVGLIILGILIVALGFWLEIGKENFDLAWDHFLDRMEPFCEFLSDKSDWIKSRI